ncbi:MAG: hypothetical protein LLF82_000301 [Dehalococcoides mccartyi]|uniref:hypothetical protein n=1 Tax=Dehalococcoides mccartyi TaxID=61435 RepID=UPI0024331297|nr:hypothetical protein [Dehalococcoides mccartyi]MCF7634835.1 hypothetical protein [Dehalococcoides mccartyi]
MPATLCSWHIVNNMLQKDFSACAVNLTNSKNLKDLLELRCSICSAISELECLIRQRCEREYELLSSTKGQLAEVDARIKQAIDSEGSYQDAVNGFYAIKQARKSVKYAPDLVEKYCPEFALAVIERHVNNDKLLKLANTGLIPQDIMRKLIGDEKTTFAFFIETPSKMVLSGVKADDASP